MNFSAFSGCQVAPIGEAQLVLPGELAPQVGADVARGAGDQYGFFMASSSSARAFTAPFGARPLTISAACATVSSDWCSIAGEREAGGVRRGDHVGARSEPRRGHLVRRSSHVERAARDVPGIERRLQRRLVDQVAARDVDEIGAALHLGEGGVVHQVFGFRRRDGERHDEVRFAGAAHRTRFAPCLSHRDRTPARACQAPCRCERLPCRSRRSR